MALGLSRSGKLAHDADAPAVAPLRPEEIRGVATAIELLPIPVALVGTGERRLAIDAANRAFRIACPGSAAAESALPSGLGDRVAAFLAGAAQMEEFDWQSGEAVDCRHFHVTLARRSGQATRCFVTLVDHTGELRTERNLRREMMTDSLTGLPNRAAFGERIEERITGTQAGRFAVLVIDIDRFSRVNACLGGMAGDELLITVARRLKGALRAVDVLARTGGDEFGILLSLEESPAEAEHAANRILGVLSTPFRLSDFEIRVDASIGIAIGSAGPDDAEEFIRYAQFAVKRSKQSGRPEYYQDQAFDIARRQFGIETQLRRAIENGELRLSYQPICDLATGKVTAFESLARWSDESGLERLPGDFIPVAEESGLIVPLGRWAIGEAARTLAAWDARAGGNCGARVSVNLSAIQLQRDAIAPVIERALSDHGLAGDRFTLELTESSLVSEPGRVAQTMRALKEIGTTLAMDDFGTGYSNLAFLQKLPIDVLKIDRSLVTGMLADRDKLAIVRAILSLAQALGMKTTAEGIETNELAQTLAALGCTYGQGYAFARPLEAEAAYSYLLASS